jgi:hypothetical protein
MKKKHRRKHHHRKGDCATRGTSGESHHVKESQGEEKAQEAPSPP